jgi:hypothetical protein
VITKPLPSRAHWNDIPTPARGAAGAAATGALSGGSVAGAGGVGGAIKPRAGEAAGDSASGGSASAIRRCAGDSRNEPPRLPLPGGLRAGGGVAGRASAASSRALDGACCTSTSAPSDSVPAPCSAPTACERDAACPISTG